MNNYGGIRSGASFASKFASEWRKRFTYVCIFAALVFILPGAVFLGYLLVAYFEEYAMNSYSEFWFMFFGPLSGFPTAFFIAAAIGYFVLILPAGILMISAPRVLAPVAAGLIDRLGLLFLLYIPVTDDDFGRNRFMEHFAGAPVSDTRINLSLSSRIWWLSGQMKPELLLGGIPKYMAGMYGDLPYSLTNAGMPVGRLGSLIVRQWYLYLSQAMAWGACCGSCGCAIILVPYFIYRVVLNVHSLAYAAAYYRILTGYWPWD